MPGVLVYFVVLGRMVRKLADMYDEVVAMRCLSVIAPALADCFMLRGSLLLGMFRLATLLFVSAVFHFICMKRPAALSAGVEA